MPGGSICSVAICKSNSKKCKEMGDKLMFFTFPKDPHIREEWIRLCYRQDKFNPENKRVCGKHFEPEDFQDRIQAKLMGHVPKKLKKDAVPSLLLLPSTCENEIESKTSKSTKVVQKRGKKLAVEPLPPNLENEPTQFEFVIVDDYEIPSYNTDREYNTIKTQMENVEQENEMLRKRIELSEKTEKALRQKILELEEQLRKKS